MIDATGRFEFLFALQTHCPEFWRNLNKLWRAGDVANLEAWSERWLRDDWLNQAYLDTLKSWDEEPGGPNARLAPEHLWFRWDCDLRAPAFEPAFKQPFPIYASSRGVGAELADLFYRSSKADLRAIRKEIEIEPLSYFERRIRSQFEKQLRAYIKQIKESWNYGSRAESTKHAQWTALVFCGMRVPQILRDGHAYRGITEYAIRKAVSRFAERIGLTLGSLRGRS